MISIAQLALLIDKKPPGEHPRSTPRLLGDPGTLYLVHDFVPDAILARSKVEYFGYVWLG